MSYQPRFFISKFEYLSLGADSYLRVTTDVEVNLTLHRTSSEPVYELRYKTVRGLSVACLPRFHLDNQILFVQDEPGDTFIHTFSSAKFPPCNKYFSYFSGTSTGQPCLSTSPLFPFHNTCPVFSNWQCFYQEEQQLQYNSYAPVNGAYSYAQKLIIPNRTLYYLSFPLKRLPGYAGWMWIGAYRFNIWRVSDNSIIAQTELYQSVDLPTSISWVEWPLITPLTINEEVRIGVSCAYSDLYCRPQISWINSDVKPGEMWSRYSLSSASWTDSPTDDLAYKYKYLPVS